jgi:hypothetical protein
MEVAMANHPGHHDFDFLMGRWSVRSRRLRERLAGCEEWIEFDATLVAWPLLDGYGNGDAFRANWGDGLVGTTLRLFDPKTSRWSIWWAGKNNPVLDSPVIGAFDGDRGVFEGEDVFDGRPILVRFVWSRVTTPTPRWEQAFSEDGGRSWETNWVMDYTRVADERTLTDSGRVP